MTDTPPMRKTPRRVTGHGAGAALCVPRSETGAMPPISGKQEWKPLVVVRRRQARRDEQIEKLLAEAKDRLAAGDVDGFRELDRRAWKMNVRSFRLSMAVMRLAFETFLPVASEEGRGA
jgi:hypothetical protein